MAVSGSQLTRQGPAAIPRPKAASFSGKGAGAAAENFLIKEPFLANVGKLMKG